MKLFYNTKRNKMEQQTNQLEKYKPFKKGEEIIETNNFFRDLSEIMEDEKFSKFFNKYFIDSNEVKVTMVYMKLYNAFRQKWKDISSEQLDKRINTFLIWKIMKDRNTSRFAIHTVMEHLDKPKNVDIFEELKQFISVSETYLE
jgi:hypothetical protein